jgi:hypothetical protein
LARDINLATADGCGTAEITRRAGRTHRTWVPVHHRATFMKDIR